jgi:hypothetical protein
MNKRNLLITLVLGIAAAVFTMRTGEDREALPFARSEIGRMRVERGIEYNCFKCPDCRFYAADEEILSSHSLIHEKEWDVNIPGVVKMKNVRFASIVPNSCIEYEIEINQTAQCDLCGSAVTVDEEHGIKQEWHKE